MRTPTSRPRTASSHDSTARFDTAVAPWTTDAVHADTIRRSGDRLIDAWQAAMVAGDLDEVDRLVRCSRAVTDAHRLLSRDERLLG